MTLTIFHPLKKMLWQKKDLIALLKRRNVLKYTVSCWNAKIKNKKVIICGQCANCLELKSLNG